MKTKYILLILLVLGVNCMYAQSTVHLSADDCGRMAIENNRTITQYKLAARQAQLDVKIADISRLPNVQGMATGMYMVPDMEMMGMKVEMRGAYMAGLQITQPIYAGGKITAGRRLARIGMDVAAEQLRMESMDVMADALKSYWMYVAVLDKVKLTKIYTSLIDTILGQTSLAVEIGMATENDLLRLNAKRSEIEYQMKKAESGAELCRLALCNAIGVDFSSQIMPVDTMPKYKPVRNPSTDISSRPELALLHHKVAASHQQVKMTLGDFLPTVGLSLGYNWYGNIKMKGYADMGNGTMIPYTSKMQDNFGVAMLAVQIPIFHWGEGAKKVRKAKLEVERAQLDLEENTRLLELQARQAALNLEDGLSLIKTAEIAITQAEENMRVMHERYDEGMSNLTDLMDAQNQWQQAKSDMIEATTQYQIYRIEWLRTIGRLGEE
ncbi:MAG: TolC family protein [Muribaculaceae bacterium]|nr:TolC family protein [Muribaculaceae bacterium]